MKRLGVFWILFMLFWAVPFPMMMYYPMTEVTSGSSPVWALIWLGTSLLVWIFFFRAIFRLFIMKPFIVRNSLANLMKNGDLKNAKIINSTRVQEEIKGTDKYKLILELQNFVGTTINETIYINDDKPFERKYETGKTVRLRIDKSLKNIPYLQIDGAHYKAPTSGRLIFGALAWLILLGVVVGYFIYSYQHQNNGTGWRFLVWYHPLVICPAVLLLIMALLRGIGRMSNNKLQHKYYGIKTQANILNVSQTGVYVNEQPQVLFQLEYTDRNNRLITVNYKKIINLLDVGIAQQKTIDIFYLESKPQNICLASELES